ncbi:MAG: DivIVA domain-containing protein [Ignavibacterium sp.]|nr:DivIVA domain-containing protein [Ignavibacterium sp.]MCX7610882.1 DivIVA domain-containing protein [Ignavibacterium sp.]MDW8374665.1 DivIVA domain-containing protein [Ignavibacteriales bacterium]
MKLSPNSIRNQVFTKRILGLNPEEVKTFLNRLADDLEVLLKEHNEQKEKIKELTEQIESYKQIESNLQQTLLKAQENSSKSIESTRKQTQLMLMEAEIKANQIIEQAKEQAKKLNEAILNLQEEKNFMIAKLEAVITTQVRLLDPNFNFDTNKSFEENLKNVNYLNIDIDKIVESLKDE